MWWFPVVVVPVVGMVLFVTAALHVVSFGPVAAKRDADQAREYQAALTELRTGRGGAATAIQLPLAPTPRRAQDEIPIPPNARLVANTTHGDGESFSIRMALEATGDVAGVLAFYRDELPLRGWEEVFMRRWRSEGAEGAAMPTSELSAFCRGEDGPRFVIAAIPTSSTTSRALIRIDSATPGPCAASPPAGAPSLDLDRSFPTL